MMNIELSQFLNSIYVFIVMCTPPGRGWRHASLLRVCVRGMRDDDAAMSYLDLEGRHCHFVDIPSVKLSPAYE